MKKYEILKKIGVIIKELQEQYEYTEQNSEDVNDLELELFVANANFLTDHIEILRKLNSQQTKSLPPEKPAQAPEPIPERRPAPETKYFEPVVQPAPIEKREAPVSFIEFDVVEERTAAAQPTPEILVTEPVKQEPEPIIRYELILDEPNHMAEETNPNEEALDNEELTEEPLETEDEIAEQQPVSEPIPEAAVIVQQPELIHTRVMMDEEEHDKPLLTINQMISAQVAATPRFGDQMELQPIKDLKSAINLNDKLLFVRDLFNGYSMAYGEAIEILNRFNKFEEADQFLKLNYYAKNNWEAKQSTADKFYGLLQRRFLNH